MCKRNLCDECEKQKTYAYMNLGLPFLLINVYNNNLFLSGMLMKMVCKWIIDSNQQQLV